MGAIFTISLFVFDEGISAHQQDKIIALETRLAARKLSDDQIVEIAKRLKPFAPQTFQIIPYWKNPESLSLANRIAGALGDADWKLENPTNGTQIVGVITGVVVNIDTGTSQQTQKAGKELVTLLNEAKVDAVAEDVTSEPPSNRIDMQVGIKP
jgi:hypothetical protein